MANIRRKLWPEVRGGLRGPVGDKEAIRELIATGR
jgi:hypothetical protein